MVTDLLKCRVEEPDGQVVKFLLRGQPGDDLLTERIYERYSSYRKRYGNRRSYEVESLGIEFVPWTVPVEVEP
jgi:hypothetical protein